MTRAEALAEARKRWGSDATVEASRYDGPLVYYVGEIAPTLTSSIRTKWGEGESWKAAFRDADRRSPLDPRD